ncbi:hypothetical protein [Algimonas porphyrae]
MRNLLAIVAGAIVLTGCMTVAKTTGSVAALPFKAAYHTTKGVGKVAVGTTKFAGKSAYATGKGVYYVGAVPVKITDAALDTTVKVLTITTKAVDLSGKVVKVSRQIQAAELDKELSKLRHARNIISVTVDAFS